VTLASLSLMYRPRLTCDLAGVPVSPSTYSRTHSLLISTEAKRTQILLIDCSCVRPKATLASSRERKININVVNARLNGGCLVCTTHPNQKHDNLVHVTCILMLVLPVASQKYFAGLG
jgi:hypothetical protein